MSMTDELDVRFEGALNSLPRLSPPPVSGLHARLRKRRVAARVVGGGLVAVVAAVGLSLGLTEGPTSPAGAVVLHVAPGVTRDELRADAVVMRNRLALLGDARARVSIAETLRQWLPDLSEDLVLATALQALWRGWLLGATAHGHADVEGFARSIEWLVVGATASERSRTRPSPLPGVGPDQSACPDPR